MTAMPPQETAKCRHQFLEKFRAPNFDMREPYPIFLFWCKLCGRTLAKQILEVETLDGVRIKEIRCVLPYEFQPWRKVVEMDKEEATKLVEANSFAEFRSYVYKQTLDKNGKKPSAE
jgi:hypothetical protein